MEIVNSDVSYLVTEHFYSLQGEGCYAGHAAYFVRLAGCRVGCSWCDSKNSWSENKATVMTVSEIVGSIVESGAKTVVITGGEPMAHDLTPLTHALRASGLRIHLETSGTESFSGVFDWVTLSPKSRLEPISEYFKVANELKVVIEGDSDFKRAEEYKNRVSEGCKLLLQCEWSVRGEMLDKIIKYIKVDQDWSLSMQTHKFIGIE